VRQVAKSPPQVHFLPTLHIIAPRRLQVAAEHALCEGDFLLEMLWVVGAKTICIGVGNHQSHVAIAFFHSFFVEIS
jgi:hypothetical protein